MSGITQRGASQRETHRFPPGLYIVGVMLLIAILVRSVPALAQDQRTIQFSIPQQPLWSAVIEFSKQARVQMLTAGSRLQGVNTPGVIGRYTVVVGIRHLLAGTHFTYRLIGNDTITLIPPPVRGSEATAVPNGKPADDPKASDSQAAAANSHPDKIAQAKEAAPALALIIVTGSRIRRFESVTANPVLTLGDQQIMATGDMTLGKLVQDLPVMTGGATNPQYAFSHGGTELSMRGLGPDRTLILVDGRRVLSQDVDSIPSAMISSIQVLKNGASAVYGSDAIGGVVNFITRKNYSGVQFCARRRIRGR